MKAISISNLVKSTELKVTRPHYLLFIEEVKCLGLLRGELGESAAPLHRAARGAVLRIGLGFKLYGGGTGGGAKQSAEAARGEVTESQEGNRADRSAGKEQGRGVTNKPDNQGTTTNIYCTVT